MYGEKLKITRDNFIDMCKGYYQQYNINWMVDNGISPKCVSSICEKYDIAHYAFDVKKIVSLNIFQEIIIIRHWYILLLIIICILF